MTKIIAIAGSLRSQSYNKLLAKAAADAIDIDGVEVQYLDLADFNIPLFSEDLEAEAVPAGVNDLKALFAGSQGLLIASPEYNGSISGVLKNAIDWLSRPSKEADIGSAFEGKVVGLLAASPGGLGGIRGLNHSRDILYNLGAIIAPGQVAIPAAYQAFDEQGKLGEAESAERVYQLANRVATLAQKIHA